MIESSDLLGVRPAREGVLMIQRSSLQPRHPQLIAISIEGNHCRQLDSVDLPESTGGRFEPLQAALKSAIEAIWVNQWHQDGPKDTLALEPGLVHCSLDLDPAPSMVLGLPPIPMASNQPRQLPLASWTIAPQWLEWLNYYKIAGQGFPGSSSYSSPGVDEVDWDS